MSKITNLKKNNNKRAKNKEQNKFKRRFRTTNKNSSNLRVAVKFHQLNLLKMMKILTGCNPIQNNNTKTVILLWRQKTS